jgi:hypothetical protein
MERPRRLYRKLVDGARRNADTVIPAGMTLAFAAGSGAAAAQGNLFGAAIEAVAAGVTGRLTVKNNAEQRAQAVQAAVDQANGEAEAVRAQERITAYKAGIARGQTEGGVEVARAAGLVIRDARRRWILEGVSLGYVIGALEERARARTAPPTEPPAPPVGRSGKPIM